MKYILLTPCGLCLEITKDQANKAIHFGKDNYHCDIQTEIGRIHDLFMDGDRWVYEIAILDEIN